MKFLVAFAVAVACASADVSHLPDQTAPVLRSEYDISPDSTFQYLYETGNGISAQAAGTIKNPNGEYPSLEVKGAYRYNSPEGPIEVSYVADENGFQPQGSHLPVGPAIPEAIVRSLAYIASHPPKPEPAQSTYKAAATLLG